MDESSKKNVPEGRDGRRVVEEKSTSSLWPHGPHAPTEDAPSVVPRSEHPPLEHVATLEHLALLRVWEHETIYVAMPSNKSLMGV